MNKEDLNPHTMGSNKRRVHLPSRISGKGLELKKAHGMGVGVRNRAENEDLLKMFRQNNYLLYNGTFLFLNHLDFSDLLQRLNDIYSFN